MKKTLNSFYLPVKFRSGEGAVRECAGEIATLGSRCFILTGGSSAKACGALDDLLSTLEALGIACRVFGGIENNPTVASCIEAGREAARFGADFVAGIGGGSVLDAAKAAAVIAACPEGGEEYLYSKNWPAAPLPILLVGTTAGTGSEVTAVSVLTDSSGRKKSVTDPRIFASLAIGDPRYTATMPRRLTLTTAVDALSHCVESYFSKKGSAISRALALSGIKLIMPPLKRIAEGGEPDAADREALYDGSIFGGMAISVTGTCFPHNVGYYLTEKNGVPHGFACAFFLPEFISHSSGPEPGLAAALEAETGFKAGDIASVARSVLPEPPLLDAAEIEAALPRWENNRTVNNSPGYVGTDYIRSLLLRFVR